MEKSEAKPLWHGQAEGRWFTRIEVTGMLNGAMLALPLHVVTGREPGPTLGIVTNTHGDEFLPSSAIRTLLDTLDAAQLKGRLALISVANPLALANFGRQTPEQHGRTDLHEVYPGNARGNTGAGSACAMAESASRNQRCAGSACVRSCQNAGTEAIRAQRAD